MKHLVTGGAGFIGRWVVKTVLARKGDEVVVLDNFSNSHRRNVAEFSGEKRLTIIEGSITDGRLLDSVWAEKGPFDTVYHLAASIRVQDSIDDPRTTFNADIVGTFEVLERCRRQYLEANGMRMNEPFHLLDAAPRLKAKLPRMVFMSTCMVYSPASGDEGIDENHPTRPTSPYAASKLAGENMALSYFLAYQMPIKVIRPFNTYGPFQKRNLEGGVVPIFIARDLNGQPLLIKGDGAQTRDLLFVEDCARFVVEAGLTDKADGEICNAGLGEDISVKDLAKLVSDRAHGGHGVAVEHIKHDHPQAEIARLLANNRKAGSMLNWRPQVSLSQGLQRTREWIRENPDAL